MVDRLVEYPYVLVRIACRYCHRDGSYRLARLAAKFGAEIPLDQLLDRIALDCPWRREHGERPPGKYQARCGAHYPDLDSRPPPDLPPTAALRIIEGGKARPPLTAAGHRKRRGV